MSEIPISTVVSVSISTTPTAPSRESFGTTLLVTQEAGISTLQGIKFYSSITEVSADWAASTEVSKAATTYFGRTPRPATLAVGTRYLTAQAGTLRSSANAEDAFAVWAAVTDGEFTISIDSDPQEITAVDFTGDLNMDDVAATIQADLQAIGTGGYTAATCTWDSVDTVFNIVSGTTGDSSLVSFLSPIATPSGTDISGEGEAGDADAFFQGRQGQGTKTAGIDAEANVADALTRFEEAGDFYFFGFTKETRDDTDTQNAAAWCEARVKEFFTTSNNEDSLNSAISTDVGSVLNALGYERTWVQYSGNPSEYPEFSAMARAAIVDFNSTDSTITMNLKQLPGISTESITGGQLATLEAKGINVYVTIGGVRTRNGQVVTGTSEDNQVQAIIGGWMVKGVGTWQDRVHGVDWLTNAIETNVFGRLFSTVTKVPLTDAGGQILAQEVTKALDEAVRNGLGAPGTDSNGNFLATGYSIDVQKVADIPAALKSQRQGPTINFVLIGAGAIHGIIINGVFEG